MHDRTLSDAAAIVEQAQQRPVRHLVEHQILRTLRELYPFAIPARELAKRLGIQDAPIILRYLALFDEVEHAGRGCYRATSET